MAWTDNPSLGASLSKPAFANPLNSRWTHQYREHLHKYVKHHPLFPNINSMYHEMHDTMEPILHVVPMSLNRKVYECMMSDRDAEIERLKNGDSGR